MARRFISPPQPSTPFQEGPKTGAKGLEKDGVDRATRKLRHMARIMCKSRPVVSPRLRVLACAWVALTLSACGKQSERRALEGAVTLNGSSLAEGSIAFVPIEGTRGPAAGGEIVQGKFKIEPEQGTFTGKFRVEIIATGLTGKKVKDALSGDMVDEYASLIPERYNRSSKLTSVVTPDGPNQFEYALTAP